jgi:hypothetical protein
MGVRSDVDPLTRAKVGRSHVIQKDEWPNHASARKRQNATDFQSAAQVLARAFDYQIEHVRLLALKEEPTATPLHLTRVNNNDFCVFDPDDLDFRNIRDCRAVSSQIQ